MKTSLALVALNALLIYAKLPTYHYYPNPEWEFTNYLRPLPPDLVQANESPAGTVSAPIGHSLPYTLRVNVSEMPVTHAIDKNDNEIDNAHIVATTFDLTYTGGKILNGTFASIQGNSSLATELWAMAYNYDFPQSVLDNYDPNTPGDCSKPLGAACVRALEQHYMNDMSLAGLSISVPECADTLGSLSKDVGDDPSIMSVVNPVPANVTDTPFLWLASAAFSGRDQDALDDELSKLQLVGITTAEKNTSSGEVSKVTSVVCLRVGGKAVQGAAPRLGPGIRTKVGAALLTAIAVVWVFV